MYIEMLGIKNPQPVHDTIEKVSTISPPLVESSVGWELQRPDRRITAATFFFVNFPLLHSYFFIIIFLVFSCDILF